jgi:hypothetical protein
MADKLDRLIADKRREVGHVKEQIERLGRDLAIAEAALSAFETAAAMRPASEDVPRRGRQPGAISKEWRDVLGEVYVCTALIQSTVSYQDVYQLAVKLDLQTDLANVRDRVRAFVNAGLMVGDPEIGFTVSTDAVERFGFRSLLEITPMSMNSEIDERV